MVWRDNRNSTSDIFAALVSPNGEVLTGPGFSVSTAPNEQSDPSIAFDGTNFFVAWTDRRGVSLDIYGARVSPGGGVVDVGGKAVSTATGPQAVPAVAFDGTNYLVVWSDTREGRCPTSMRPG